MRILRKQIFTSVIAFVLCLSMLLGTTFAWFTDSSTSSNNIITSGTLDAEMYYSDTLLPANSTEWQNADGEAVFTYNKWEPGYTEVKYIKVTNEGNLALKWRLTIEKVGQMSKLADVIDVFYFNPATETITSLDDFTSEGLLAEVVEERTAMNGVLLAKNSFQEGIATGEVILAIAFHMDEEANNEYQGISIGDGFALNLVATQYTYEGDSFGEEYDKDSAWPNTVIVNANSATKSVSTNAQNETSAPVSLTSTDGYIQGYIPSGVLMENGVTEATRRIGERSKKEANITLDQNEACLSIDVHIDGVSPDNQVVMEITIKQLLPKNLNEANVRLYHVENGETVAMTLLQSGATPVHNNFTYDPATGDTTMYLKSFSEVALVADTTGAWKGGYDYTWYDPSEPEFFIANADQLAAFGAIVGGMAEGIDRDSFKGKTVTLLGDIDLGYDTDDYSIFYPIGYYNNTGKYDKFSGVSEETGEAVTSTVYSFEGTFDGNGHTIRNFYQNTWEMFGDYNSGYSGTPNHYKDAMGLFGYVANGKITNLTVSNFSSDGEYTPTGVITAYAMNSTFENIAIVSCNPGVYNTGNGGIVGIGGNDDDPDSYSLTFKNVSVDNTNKITALWGSYDVACGGLVGMFRGAGHVYMNNCHVSAQMDVYNDVCGNYQYYWYRYSGMLIGTNKTMVTDDNGYTVPETKNYHAEDCTVYFGDWNNYYYCELVANTVASYTHDHQFSRLTQVKSVDVEGKQVTSLEGKKTAIPQSGRYNYVVVNGDHATEHATCYHFVDGQVHNHSDSGYHDGENGEKYIDENNDGHADLKEDKQHIYLPFNNQLFTGYGWGVKYIPLGEFSGVTIRDKEETDTKFEANPYYNGKSWGEKSTFDIGDLFSAIDETQINKDSVKVGITVLNNANARVTYTPDETNWKNGRITVTGSGTIQIVITDYDYCKETTVTLIITENGSIHLPWVGDWA